MMCHAYNNEEYRLEIWIDREAGASLKIWHQPASLLDEATTADRAGVRIYEAVEEPSPELPQGTLRLLEGLSTSWAALARESGITPELDAGIIAAIARSLGFNLTREEVAKWLSADEATR